MADRNTLGLGLASPTQHMACSSPEYSTGTSPLQHQSANIRIMLMHKPLLAQGASMHSLSCFSANMSCAATALLPLGMASARVKRLQQLLPTWVVQLQDPKMLLQKAPPTVLPCKHTGG